ncbi:hypothetical protein CIHG_04668 [Coccidioides immitis H538.4]|uniref:Uncharacterized protein n=1 Tax=Coccidioides immitis H538.4 TaxID=396776 RepID=A0A0J8RTF9_COCIT|nr:hypothetical protein CIHG_04668 [Coccidioides immitis H538.4]
MYCTSAFWVFIQIIPGLGWEVYGKAACGIDLYSAGLRKNVVPEKFENSMTKRHKSSKRETKHVERGKKQGVELDRRPCGPAHVIGRLRGSSAQGAWANGIACIPRGWAYGWITEHEPKPHFGLVSTFLSPAKPARALPLCGIRGTPPGVRRSGAGACRPPTRLLSRDGPARSETQSGREKPGLLYFYSSLNDMWSGSKSALGYIWLCIFMPIKSPRRFIFTRVLGLPAEAALYSLSAPLPRMNHPNHLVYIPAHVIGLLLHGYAHDQKECNGFSFTPTAFLSNYLKVCRNARIGHVVKLLASYHANHIEISALGYDISRLQLYLHLL